MRPARLWHSVRGQVKRVVFDSDWSDAGVTNYAYWCTGMNALTEVHGFEECSGCANVTQTSTSYNRLESICATSFDNSSITSYTSVLYGCNRLVGGTGYVPTSTAGKNNLALGSNGVLTNPTNDSRTWVWAHFYDTGALEITATRTPDVQRTVLATGRICSNAHYQAVGATVRAEVEPASSRPIWPRGHLRASTTGSTRIPRSQQ